jgi:hypothetical protein
VRVQVLRYCMAATDAAGNRSRRSGAFLVIG